VRILHDHRARNRLRIVNRLIQFFLGDVLIFLSMVRTGSRPAPAGFSTSENHWRRASTEINILPARPRSSSSNACSDAALADILHPHCPTTCAARSRAG